MKPLPHPAVDEGMQGGSHEGRYLLQLWFT